MCNNIFGNCKLKVYCFIIILSAMVSGCAIPMDGPRSSSFETEAFDRVGTIVREHEELTNDRVDYILVDVDNKIIKELSLYNKYKFSGQFPERSRPAASIGIGVGDTLSVTIFEASPGGLFTPKENPLSQGNFVRFPNQEVDKTGTIKIPFAGSIQVVGRYPVDIQKEIERKLSNRAVEPQVIVSITRRASNLVTVLGDVQEAGRFNINLKSYRILDAIGSAKGNKFQDFETLVTLLRRGKRASVMLSSLTHYPRSNIEVQLNDTIFVQRNQRFFSLLGAINKPGNFLFDRNTMTIADALSKGEGLIDARADAYTVILYRYEKRRLLEKYGAKIPVKYKTYVPTLYRFNILDTDGLFFAKNFRLRNHDLLYVANSPWVDALKINRIVRDYASTIRGGRGVVESFATGIPKVGLIRN